MERGLERSYIDNDVKEIHSSILEGVYRGSMMGYFYL
nr:MAG TPA: hypothetical protein [Caudoviricetes sp.]